MPLSDEALEEFTQIYREEFGETLTRGEASELASRVLTLYKLLARPLPSERSAPESRPPDVLPA